MEPAGTEEQSVATETVEGAAIHLSRASSVGETDVSDLDTPAGRRSALRGALIGLALIALAAIAALLFTAATFGYSLGELL